MTEKRVNEKLDKLRREELLMREDVTVKIVCVVIFAILLAAGIAALLLGMFIRAPMRIFSSPYYISAESIAAGNLIVIAAIAVPALINRSLWKVWYSKHGVSGRVFFRISAAILILMVLYNIADLIAVIPTYFTAVWN